MKPTTAETLKEYFSSGKNKAAWEAAKEKAKEVQSFGNYDDGKYDAQLIEIKINRSKTSNRLQVVMAFKFVGGEYAGKKFYKYCGIEDGVEYLLRDFASLGYEDVDLDDEEDIFKKINKEKPSLQVKLVTDGKFQNVYLLAGEVKAEEAGQEPEEQVVEEKGNEVPNIKKGSTVLIKEDDEWKEEEVTRIDDEDFDTEDHEDLELDDFGDTWKLPEEEKDEKKEESNEEKVILKAGMKLKVQLKNEVKIGKIVNIDDDEEKVKIKFKDGTKEWIGQDKIVDVVEESNNGKERS